MNAIDGGHVGPKRPERCTVATGIIREEQHHDLRRAVEGVKALLLAPALELAPATGIVLTRLRCDRLQTVAPSSRSARPVHSAARPGLHRGRTRPALLDQRERTRATFCARGSRKSPTGTPVDGWPLSICARTPGLFRGGGLSVSPWIAVALPSPDIEGLERLALAPSGEPAELHEEVLFVDRDRSSTSPGVRMVSTPPSSAVAAPAGTVSRCVTGQPIARETAIRMLPSWHRLFWYFDTAAAGRLRRHLDAVDLQRGTAALPQELGLSERADPPRATRTAQAAVRSSSASERSSSTPATGRGAGQPARLPRPVWRRRRRSLRPARRAVGRVPDGAAPGAAPWH